MEFTTLFLAPPFSPASIISHLSCQSLVHEKYRSAAIKSRIWSSYTAIEHSSSILISMICAPLLLVGVQYQCLIVFLFFYQSKKFPRTRHIGSPTLTNTLSGVMIKGSNPINQVSSSFLLTAIFIFYFFSTDLKSSCYKIPFLSMSSVSSSGLRSFATFRYFTSLWLSLQPSRGFLLPSHCEEWSTVSVFEAAHEKRTKTDNFFVTVRCMTG
jgi:hypothetical protein